MALFYTAFSPGTGNTGAGVGSGVGSGAVLSGATGGGASSEDSGLCPSHTGENPLL